jgi:beta-lactamase regulating signal transducer with metallopeptidase domain
MRTATLYNFLVEANLIAGIAILLLVLVRRLLRRQIGNRALYFAWLLVAVRLLCPLALPNPAINEIRPGHLDDQAIRPIAAQIKVRFTDASDSLAKDLRLSRGQNDPITLKLGELSRSIYYGTFPYQMMIVYFCGTGAVLCWFILSNVRFRRKMRAGRIEQISGRLQEQYQELCARLKIKPIPVYYTDPLPSACLVGVFRPYIALPLTAAPREAIQVLTHEVFHYKGKDHSLSLLRLLCCVLHWFNPLVWLAANMSRTDAELNCDDHVVEKLDQEEKLAYTNALVLAAAKRDAPGVSVLATGMTMTGKKLKNRVSAILYGGPIKKGLAISFTLLASIALIAAFATAEYHGRPVMPAISQSKSAAYTSKNIASDADAIAYAQAFWRSGYMGIDASNGRWTTEFINDAYVVRAELPSTQVPAELSFLPNGMITSFKYDNGWTEARATANLYDQDTALREEAGKYILEFAKAMLPGVADTIDGLQYTGEGEYDNKHYVAFAVPNQKSPVAYQFQVQVLPKVQMVFYMIDETMYKEPSPQEKAIAETFPAGAPVTKAGGFDAYDKAFNNNSFTSPSTGDISLEDALEIAVQAVCEKFGETEQSMTRFRLEYGFKTDDDASFKTPYWQFDFRSSDPLDNYEIIIHSPDGKILYTCGPGEANG